MPGGGGCKVSAPMSPPPHALGCHQRLGARPLREGISLTLLHGSCCGVGDRCGPEGCCPGGQRRLSLCPRTWLCTLCWGSGEQSCLLTIVGGNPWAVIPLGAGWGVQGTAATLGLTAVSQKPRASPVLAALSWPLRCGTSGAQAGGKSSWKPEGEEMGAPAEVHHGTYERAIWTRKCLWPAGWKCLCQQDYSPGTMGSRSPTA